MRLPFVTGITMLVLLALGIGVTTQHIWQTQTATAVSVPKLDHALISGKTTAEFADNYSRELPFREFAIDFWGVFNYLLFKEGQRGVLIGSDDWLYSSEEFEISDDENSTVRRKLSYIAAVDTELKARSITLVIALLPAKARIYPEYLGNYLFPQIKQARYADVLQQLHDRDISAPDLRPALLAAKSQAPVFLRTDTHWTNFGARTVARALAAVIEPLALPSTNFQHQALATIEYQGDLLRYVRLGSLMQALGPAPDSVTPFEARPASEGNDLFGSSQIPITLVGTSYSANSLWSFAEALKLETNTDVLNVANEGQGPIEPMGEYLRSDELSNAPPTVVVWELPERYLSQAYPQQAFKLSTGLFTFDSVEKNP